MPTLFDKLASDVITAMQPKQAAALDLYSVALKAAREGTRAISTKMEALLDKSAKMMARQKFEMNRAKSYLGYKVWTSGDGLMLEGEIHFTDVADTYRSEEEVRKIFEAMLDVDPSRVYGTFDKWKVTFSK